MRKHQLGNHESVLIMGEAALTCLTVTSHMKVILQG